MYTFRPLEIKALCMCPINRRIILFVGYYLLKLRILKPHLSSMPYYKLSIYNNVMKCALFVVIYIDLLFCICMLALCYQVLTIMFFRLIFTYNNYVLFNSMCSCTDPKAPPDGDSPTSRLPPNWR